MHFALEKVLIAPSENKDKMGYGVFIDNKLSGFLKEIKKYGKKNFCLKLFLWRIR